MALKKTQKIQKKITKKLIFYFRKFQRTLSTLNTDSILR